MSITFDKDGFAEASGWVDAYQCNPLTGEFLGIGESYVTKGAGLPAGAYIDTPPAIQQDKVIVRISRESGWQLLDDFRGQTAYEISSKTAVLITWIGPLPQELTLLEPGEYDSWNGERWVFDQQLKDQLQMASAKEQQAKKIDEANQQIAILKPAVDGGYAKPEHTQLLADWQRCRYELTLVPEQPGWPERPQWPVPPATVI
ncbi:tail fiber assembly protein [Aeromonas veronii]|uniref:tail fiber assembly protein n=1 Tax=Aeromonas veronii TaxID=654 RepID=UPI0021E80523|nr:tail fiber assembly protein [Aeromonas veronii]MCV3283466.1 tail fiber assembly protein [Aeromonas veronii]